MYNTKRGITATLIVCRPFTAQNFVSNPSIYYMYASVCLSVCLFDFQVSRVITHKNLTRTGSLNQKEGRILDFLTQGGKSKPTKINCILFGRMRFWNERRELERSWYRFQVVFIIYHTLLHALFLLSNSSS